ncbi:MAG: ABC transporter substrate-binding protein [Clostridiales bacterium]|nr:ABC transporter substrate-binding protein [Clostridiales bacterium]
MKRIFLFCLMFLFLPVFPTVHAGEIRFTDALGREIILEKRPERAVSFLGSFAENWLLSGGALSGTTEDTVSERGIALDENTLIIGTNKKPSLELTISLSPDFLILSAELEAHLALKEVLDTLSVPYAYFSVNTWQEYIAMMNLFCAINDVGADSFAHLETVEAPILAEIERAKASPLYGEKTCLLLRAYSTGVKAKGSDNLAGAILQDMGLVNLADSQETLLESLSLEGILMMDPDYIFITTMGSDPEKAMIALQEQFSSSPAWQALSAVQNGRVIELDRELFHLKPNARWAESYQVIGELLYAP